LLRLFLTPITAKQAYFALFSQKYNILLTKPFVENPHTFVSTLFVLKKLFYDSNKLTKTKSK